MANTNTNTNNQILKFQDLEVDETYTIRSFKPINGQYGKSYILSVIKNGEDRILNVFSANTINKYFEVNEIEKHPKKFDFTVRKINKGKYAGKNFAEIDGFNNANAGFIEMQ